MESEPPTSSHPLEEPPLPSSDTSSNSDSPSDTPEKKKLKGTEESSTPGTAKKCPFCDSVQPDSGALWRHLNVDSSTLRRTCGSCNQPFPNEEHLLEDLAQNAISFPSLCFVCAARFTNNHGVIKHLKSSHGYFDFFLCCGCGQFCTLAFYYMHMKLHNLRAGFSRCETPEIIFPTDSLLEKLPSFSANAPVAVPEPVPAAPAHEGEPEPGLLPEHESEAQPGPASKMECAECHAVFDKPDDLCPHLFSHVADKLRSQVCDNQACSSGENREHVASQAGEPNSTTSPEEHQGIIICPNCGDHLPFNSFRNHLKKHKQNGKDGKYKCEICLHEFNALCTFENHVNQHLKLKPLSPRKQPTYTCNDCSRVFPSEKLLVDHAMQKHRESKPFFCTICKIKFSRNCGLTQHRNMMHPESLNCPTCSETFETEDDFRTHYDQHADLQLIFCELCPTGFPEQRHVDDHMKKWHPSPNEPRKSR